MNEEFEGIQRPIYHNLWLLWLTQLVTLVLIPFNGVVFALIGLAVSIVQLYAVYQMREVSDGMSRAWRWMIASIALTFGGLVLTLLALGSALAILLLLVTLAGVIGMLVAEFYLYAGLDDLILPRGYDYPVGRIRWCFWLQLIGSFASSLFSNLLSPWLGMLVQLVTMAVILWLLWLYLQAVKAREEA